MTPVAAVVALALEFFFVARLKLRLACRAPSDPRPRVRLCVTTLLDVHAQRLWAPTPYSDVSITTSWLLERSDSQNLSRLLHVTMLPRLSCAVENAVRLIAGYASAFEC